MIDWKQKAQNLLNSDEGREELERLLGGKIVSKEQPEDIPVVAALVPCYDHPDPRMQEAFIKLQLHSRDHCVMFPGPPISSSVIHWSRNWLIAELIKTQRPWTHVLFMDDDIVPPSDALVRMLAHKKDIVAAICTRRTDPPIPNIRYFDEATTDYREIWNWPQNKLIEVGAVGTGMMLISRNALEQVAQAYFDCRYEKEFYGVSDEWIEDHRKRRLGFFDENANAFWFRFLPCLKGTFEMGEDVFFCFMAKRHCGIPVYCDTSIQPEHIGHYGYGIKDFLPYRDAMIEKAKMEGRYDDKSNIKAEEPSQNNTFRVTYEDEKEPVTA